MSPQAAGAWYTVIVTALVGGAAGVAKHWVDAHFKRKRDEDERMAEREAEIAENEALAPLRAEIIRLSVEKNEALERLAEAEYSAKVSADEAAGLGEEVRRIAGEKALAEQERDDEMRKRVAAETEAAEWKRLAEDAERREALETAKKHADRVTPPKETASGTRPFEPIRPEPHQRPMDRTVPGAGGAGSGMGAKTVPPRLQSKRRGSE